MLSKIVFGQVTVLQLIYFVLVLLLAFLFTRFLVKIIQKKLRGRVNDDRIQNITKLITYATLTLTLLFALPLLGAKLSGLAVAGGVAGVVIGFASQNVVSNFISGLFILLERPIRIGNEVNISGTEGFVEEVRIMSTLIRTYAGQRVRIPNINVFTSTLINYEAYSIRRIDYLIGIRYNDDANVAINAIRERIDAEPFALVNPEPIIFVSNLGDNSVDIAIRFWVPTQEFYTIKFQLLNSLKIAVEAKGIQIPFPQRVLWHEKNE